MLKNYAMLGVGRKPDGQVQLCQVGIAEFAVKFIYIYQSHKTSPTYLTLCTQMTTIVIMNIGTSITNDDYSRHGHY